MRLLTFKHAVGRKGMALITVVSVLALATILLLALFSNADNEFKSTQGYAAGQTARQFGDMSVNVVMGQLQKAARQESPTVRMFHVTQPGGARKYNANGQFAAGYKLFSDAEMEVIQAGAAGEKRFVAGKDGVPLPTDWNGQPNRFVDLNDPVVRSKANGSGLDVFFPVVDPRSFTTSTTNPSIEGFSYSSQFPTVGGTGGGSIGGVVLPGGAATPEAQRVPMPVEWIYVLKDGTMGTLSSSNIFIPAPGASAPTVDNPIVGRIAFWTDDESCKVNINTASEPTFWGVPRFYHEREHEWAEKPSTAREYQRFPGHPATVALSSVLYPNPQQIPARDLVDLFGRTSSEQQRIINIKEAIYTMIPKINLGGSKCGTLVFAQDSYTGTEAAKVDLSGSSLERLFASLDELLFTEDKNGVRRRVNNITDSSGNVIFDESVLERSRFFLTAQSRAPEFNIMGLPRVSMWPISTQNNDRYRTPYDQLIAFCSTLNGGAGPTGSHPYYFQRERAHDADFDINISRNANLMLYLLKLMQMQLPNTGAAGSSAKASFEAKYGADNARQILVQIFDYVRATNLYDDILSKNNSLVLSPTSSSKAVYEQSPSQYFTYTNPLALRNRTADGSTAVTARNVADNGWPGHGQVTPSHWKPGGGTQASTYMGFGRNFTISEVGMQFICTADGQNDANSYKFPANDANPVISGGGTAERINPDIENVYQNEGNATAYGKYLFPDGVTNSYWYSNYPPFPSAGKYGTKYPAPPADPRNANRHPGYDPLNWNCTLATDTELKPTEKRVQALLNLELFVPMEGWTLIYPEYTIKLDGDYISAITVNGQPIFSTAKDTVVKSAGNVYTPSGVHRTGGVTPPRALYSGFKLKGADRMPPDSGYDTTDNSKHGRLVNCDLVSSFFTVDNTKNMEVNFPATGGLNIEIYDSHDWENKVPVQKMTVNFAQAFGTAKMSTPAPTLAKRAFPKKRDFPNGRQRVIRAVEGPRYWCFNADGALGRYWRDGAYNPFHANVNRVTGTSDINGLGERVLGRFVGVEGYSTIYSELSSNLGSDIVRTVIPALGDYRIIAARYDVPASIWQPHRYWSDAGRPNAHNFSAHAGDGESGVDLGNDNTPAAGASAGGTQFVKVLKKRYLNSKVPDMPRTAVALQALNSFMDYDNGVGSSRDGAFVNKPDEGNFSKLNFWRNPPGSEKELRNAYFTDSWEMEPDKTSDDRYFTPNRLIPSPGMFGSLPTAVFNSPTGGVTGYTGPGRPWQTLLFRPHAPMPNLAESGTSANAHPGAQNPPDHLIMDMFNMPVVEPYAISEPLSQAGKINVNQQIVPFTYINRTTGLWAVLKGELLTAVNRSGAAGKLDGGHDGSAHYKGYLSGTFPYTFWTEGSATTNAYWHRRVNVEETVKQFTERFNFDPDVKPETRQGLLRSPSQICELHLIPASVTGSNVPATNAANRDSVMGAFWEEHALTGDNSKERAYTNIYPKLTTRSNTFRVHFRTQVIKKARSIAPSEFAADKDSIASEYRGSTLIERYIDPNDTANPLPNYADGTSPLSKTPLDSFYRFRVLEHKRFAP